MMKKGFLLAGILLAFATLGCHDSSTAPEEQLDPLSDAEQMQLVAAEVSQQNGGIMADLNMAASTSNGAYSAMAKSAGFDTSLTVSWITYDLSLAYFNSNGAEQPRFLRGLTDSVTYVSSLSGNYSSTNDAIRVDLNSSSVLTADAILSGKIMVSGSGANHSKYSLSGTARSLDVQAASSYKVQNVVFDLSASTLVPASGELVGTLKGTYTKLGGRVDLESAYDFTFTIVFDGDQTVTVTLPSGKKYTLHLLTGLYFG